MYANQDLEEVQYNSGKNRNAVYNTWRVHQNTENLVQFEARSEKRIAVRSNTIQRNRSFQHTTCDMY